MGETDARILTDRPVRDAASVVVVRLCRGVPHVLMGQRGRGAAFLPGKTVFPGGAVEPGDAEIALAGALNGICAARLRRAGGPSPEALAAAAIRELWEETGQIVGRLQVWDQPPSNWSPFAKTGHAPDASGLRYIFRAVTPPGRSRRFDARFFLLRSEALATDPDRLIPPTDELGHLGWSDLETAKRLDLAFITRIVLGEVPALLDGDASPPRVPFFRNAPPWHVEDGAAHS